MADIDFGTFLPGERGTQTYAIPAEDRDSTAAVSGDAGFVLRPQAPGDERVSIEFTAGQVSAGDKTATLTCGATSATLQAKVEHRVEVETAAFVGASLVGTAVTKQVTVTNNTDATATLAVTGDFTVSPSSLPASPGPQLVTVTFTPSALDTRTGALTVTAGSLSDSCDLMGTGIETADPGSDPDTVQSLDTTTSDGATKTTYKVHVPSASTKMHLGAAVSPFAIDGFGLTTQGKTLVQSKSDVGVNSSEGDVKIQAEGSGSDSGGGFFTISKNNTVIAAGGSAYLLGDGGVVISTATDASPALGDDGLPAPGKLTTASNVASLVFAALDGMIAFASLGRVAYTTKWTKWRSKPVDVGMAAVSAGAAFTAGTLGGFSVANAAGASFSVPGVTIYGHAGVLIGTAGFGGFYAPAGLVLGSIFPILLGMDAEVLGLRTAGLTGKNATVTARDDLEVTGGDSVKVASKAKIDLQIDQSGSSPTSTVAMESSEIGLQTTEQLTILVGGASGPKYLVRVDATDGVHVGTDDGSLALDTTKPHAKISATGIDLAVEEGGTFAKMEKNLIRLRHAGSQGFGVSITDKLVSLYDGPGKNMVKVQNDMIHVQAGSSANALMLKPSGIKAKGTMIEWG